MQVATLTPDSKQEVTFLLRAKLNVSTLHIKPSNIKHAHKPDGAGSTPYYS